MDPSFCIARLTSANKAARSSGFLHLILFGSLVCFGSSAFAQSAASLYNSGWQKAQRGDLDGAIADFTKAIELKPLDPSYYLSRSGVERQKQDFDSAIADCTRAIVIRPDPSAYMGRAGAKIGKEDYDGAVADYTKAIGMATNSPLGFCGRGSAKIYTKDYSGAIADYTRAIELNPDYADAFYGRGIAKDDVADFDGAIADYTRAIEIKPDFAFAYSNRADAKRSKGDVDGAAADCDKSIELDPNNAISHFNRGLCQYERHRFNSALADFPKALRYSDVKGIDGASFFLYLTRSRLGESEKAAAELRAYLKMTAPNEKDAWIVKLGQFLAGDGNETDLLKGAGNADAKKTRSSIPTPTFMPVQSAWLRATLPVQRTFLRSAWLRA